MIKGAEATVKIEDERVIKTREPKNYRHSDLDNKIREERTDTEIKLIKDAKRHNVNAPEAEKIDNFTIEMDRIEGNILKDSLSDSLALMKSFGKNIGYLHSTEIIHGDLTTSNAMVSDDKLFVIDFGLSYRSQRVEDKAVDIHLLKQVLNSSHPDVADEAWEKFVEGYSDYDKSNEVLQQLKDVEKRGRYK